MASAGRGTTVPSGSTVRPAKPDRRTSSLCSISISPWLLPSSVRILIRPWTESREKTSCLTRSSIWNSPLWKSTAAGALGAPSTLLRARSASVIGGKASAPRAAPGTPTWTKITAVSATLQRTIRNCISTPFDRGISGIVAALLKSDERERSISGALFRLPHQDQRLGVALFRRVVEGAQALAGVDLDELPLADLQAAPVGQGALRLSDRDLGGERPGVALLPDRLRLRLDRPAGRP